MNAVTAIVRNLGAGTLAIGVMAVGVISGGSASSASAADRPVARRTAQAAPASENNTGPAYLRFVHIGHTGQYADLVMDDVPLVRAIGSSAASPFVAVPSGWHHLETSVRGDDGSIELVFGSLAAGRSYDIVRRGDPNTAAALVEEPVTGGSLRVLDLRSTGAAPVQLRGLGKVFTVSPGAVVARSPVAAATGAAIVSVTDVSGFELTRASVAPHGTDHQDLALIIDGDHGTEIVSFSARSPIVMTPRVAVEPRESGGGSAVPTWALAAGAVAAIAAGGVAGRRRGRRRRKLAAIASQHAFRQSVRA